jgi:glucosamine-6-phosphate deaminase
MEYIHTSDYQTLGQQAARFIAREILQNPAMVLGLPTGGTPISMYRYLAKLVAEKLISFAQVQTFNLDEYAGLSAKHPQSYYMFMQEHFISQVDINPAKFTIPQGDTPDLQTECQRYDNLLEESGGLDLQVLGLGLNGHIGFNEPSLDLHVRTHVVDLTPETIKANARYFTSIDQVPQQAITMGIGSIMQARKILLLVSGEEKRTILYKTLLGPVRPEVPASVLQLHANLTVISDIDLRGNGI